MTVYNVLAGLPASTVAVIAKVALMPEDDVLMALVMLVGRKWVRIAGGDGSSRRFALIDPKRRLVRWRDRSDADLVEGGVQVGGWTGWMVQCRQRGRLSIEDAVREGTA
mgnify:CR=1 FL=1